MSRKNTRPNTPPASDPAPAAPLAEHVDDAPPSPAIVEALAADATGTRSESALVGEVVADAMIGVRNVTVQANLVPTAGYVPTSFGVSLSGKAAQALADYAAGLEVEGVYADPGRALNVLLERLAGE